MTLVLLLISLLLLHTSTPTPTTMRMLLVVGSVSVDSARVLVDRAADDERASIVVRASLVDANGVEAHERLTVELTARAAVVTFRNLTAATRFFAHFAMDDNTSEVVTFSTLPLSSSSLSSLSSSSLSSSSSSSSAPWLGFASCNRLNEDNDDSFWTQLARDQSLPTPTTVIHMGDQVYLDRELPKFIERARHTTTEQNYNATVAAIRRIYRSVWTRESVAVVLRRSENLMLPDDHGKLPRLLNKL
jgi:phosphodiesterase/alkaline phosphatase D-like protein